MGSVLPARTLFHVAGLALMWYGASSSSAWVAVAAPRQSPCQRSAMTMRSEGIPMSPSTVMIIPMAPSHLVAAFL